MFIVRVAARARDGASEEVRQVLREQIQEVPRRFPRCLTYRACVDAHDPLEFLVYEEWPSREVYLECHTSEYAAQVMSRLGPLLDDRDAAFFLADPVALTTGE